MRRILIVMATLAATACASTGAVPRPFPTPEGASPAPQPGPPSPGASGARDGYAITGTALALRGVPYRNGGSDPVAGFDCSGFVWYVFGQHGIQVPRTVSEQYLAGSLVTGNGLQPGDLVFFSTNGAGPSHVGIAIGGDQFVHAPSSTGDVRVERLGSGYWAGRFIGARRM